jgi:hypothetical protein
MSKWKIALLVVAVPALGVFSNVYTHVITHVGHSVVRDLLRAMF